MDKHKGKEKLFGEFSPISSKEWMDKITDDLKGNPFEKLLWKTADGFTIQPFYRKEDMEDLLYLDREPGAFPFVRTGKKYLNDWEIRQDITVKSIRQANEKALHALNWGATSICFHIPGNLPLTRANFKDLLKGIFFDCINLNFHAPGKENDIFNYLLDEAKDQNIENERITGSINIDPTGRLCLQGNYYKSEEEDFLIASELIKKAAIKLPNLRLIGLSGSIFNSSGASSTQELAFCLAQASEYFNRYTAHGAGVDQIARSMQLNLATGPLFFIELARIRAARLLFARLIDAWKPLQKNSCKIFIHTHTSEWNQTVFDPYVNMLRGTTESMASALGGADSITVVPFDNSFRDTTKFSERIARNTQVILKEEAYFDKVIDPGAGSYYIEKITDSLAESSWKLFLDIENRGGFTESLKAGFIQDMLNKTAQQRDMNIATRREILLGTNQYPDYTEKPIEDYNSQTTPLVLKEKSPIVKPLKIYRGALAFEEIRKKTLTRNGGIPKVFLLTYGNITWRVARSSFSTNFFGCAGYDIIENYGFESVKEGVEAALNSNSSIVVLCSADDQYPVIAPEAKKLLGNKALLVIAGYPKDSVDELKSIGIEYFIHMKSNILEELKKFSEILDSKLS